MIAVIMPVYGKTELTNQVVDQLAQQMDSEDIYIIDNKGDYIVRHQEAVYWMTTNLRWTKGSNFGIKFAQMLGNDTHDGYLLLNNDVVLSNGFIEGLERCLQDTQAGVCAPLYDDVWPQQHGSYRGVAQGYQKPYSIGYRQVSFVDGTAMLISRSLYEQLGGLDEINFGTYGWGAEISYCYEARKAGYEIVVTDQSYLNHLRQQTAKTIASDWEALAGQEMEQGMTNKYGPNWRELVY